MSAPLSRPDDAQQPTVGQPVMEDPSAPGQAAAGPVPEEAAGQPVGEPAQAAVGSPREPARAESFQVHLANFEGPFDLLLQLISKHQLDVTEVALSQVTDEFIAHIRAAGSAWDLGQATEFLVVAATLLDLKAARLLPAAEVEDEEDLALLEARDLLFARLLQYRAYKQVAAWFRELETVQARRHPRAVTMEPRFASLLPEVLLGLGPDQFARLAAAAMTPKAPPVVSLDHVHAPRVSVREHAAILRERLARIGSATFRSLVADCSHTLEVVARFLALLELYRATVVAFEQVTPLGELHVRWTGVAADSSVTHGDGEGSDVDEEYG
ncbi:MAG TPA: segregation/condensation protein A [Mycobacteriales bacterium]